MVTARYFISFFIYVLGCIFLVWPTSGQPALDPVPKKVDLSQYDAHPVVNDLAQDHLGFIWIATDLGLYRFDGIYTKQYTLKTHPGLPGDKIYAILSGADNQLWIATNGGLCVMNTETDNIRTIQVQPDDYKGETVPTHVYQASDSSVWIGMKANMFCRVTADSVLQFGRLTMDDFPLGDCFEVVRIIEGKDDKIFIEAECGYRVSMFTIHPAGQQLISKLSYTAEIGVAHLVRFSNEVYVLDRGELIRYDPVSQEFDREHGRRPVPGMRKFGISCIVGSGSDSFLAGAGNGELWRCNLGRDTILVTRLGNFIEARVLDIMEDRSGCLWLGTADGVVYFSVREPRFTTYFSRSDPGQQYGFRARGILESRDGYIYVCNYDGLYRIDPLVSSNRMSSAKVRDLAQPYALCQGKEDFIWVGSDGYGLYKFDFEQGRFYDRISPYARVNRMVGSWVGELLKDSERTLWVGTNNGIAFLEDDSPDFKVALDQDGNSIFQNTFTHDIKEIVAGEYWIGTSKGLFRIRRIGTDSGVYFDVRAHELVPFRIREMHQNETGELWLATEDAGLVRYRQGSGIIQRYTEVNGLPDDVLYSMLPGPNGELWIGTFNGLSRMDTASGLFNNFYTSDGLPHNEFNSQSQLIGSNGMFYMGTQDGIVSFNPDEFTMDSSGIRLLLTGMRIQNTRRESIMTEARFKNLTDGIQIGPNDDLVSIQYSIADYNNPAGNRFQYRVIGLSPNWHYVGNETEFVLPHLRPGSYTVQIRGAGSDGRWSRHQLEVPITVRAAFYNSWWFSIVVLSTLAVIMWMIHRYRINEVMKLQRLRLRIAEDLHDELGSSLTGIGIQTQLLSVADQSEERGSKLKEISGQIQEAVSRLGDIVWSLQPESGTLGELIDRVEEQVLIMIDTQEIECKIDLAHDNRDLQLRDIVKQNVFLIFKEALTNIVKHSNADKIEVVAKCMGNSLLLRVADNGTAHTGPASRGGGNGLKNMHRRARKMGGQLRISKNPGFSVELTVPKAFST